MNGHDDLFGESRLGRLVEAHAHLPSEELRERVLREIAAFVGDAPQHDDMTMILVKVDEIGVGAVPIDSRERLLAEVCRGVNRCLDGLEILRVGDGFEGGHDPTVQLGVVRQLVDGNYFSENRQQALDWRGLPARTVRRGCRGFGAGVQA
jgi:hypothetical protein